MANRGMFGYEGEGYLHGAAREVDRDYEERDRDREYGGRYDRDTGLRRGDPSYSGRGPKNYQRSDDRIREDVCERLTYDHDVDASDIEVQVASGTVTLSGTVHDRYQKRRAEDVADACTGVREVENHLRLAR